MTERQKEELDKGRRSCTHENAVERQKKGVEKRLQNKTGRELVKAILAMVVNGEEAAAIQAELGVEEKITREVAMHLAQAKLASKAELAGSTNAYKAVLTAAGIYEEKQSIAIEELPERMTPSEAIDYVAQLNK